MVLKVLLKCHFCGDIFISNKTKRIGCGEKWSCVKAHRKWKKELNYLISTIVFEDVKLKK